MESGNNIKNVQGIDFYRFYSRILGFEYRKPPVPERVDSGSQGSQWGAPFNLLGCLLAIYWGRTDVPNLLGGLVKISKKVVYNFMKTCVLISDFKI